MNPGDSCELVPVPFHDDTILATRRNDGVVLVSIKRICESLGIDFSSQLTKLKKYEWAGVVEIATPDLKGTQQRTSVIDLESLPMWMVTIQPGKVSLEARGKLRAYQTEAKAVLARHFVPDAALQKDPMIAQLEMMLEARQQALEQSKRITAVEQETALARSDAKEAITKAEAALATLSGETGYVALVGYCRSHHLKFNEHEMAKIGSQLARNAKASGIPIKKVPSEHRGTINAYPVSYLDSWRESLQPTLAVV